MAVTIPLLIDIDKFKFYLGISESFDSRYLEPIIIQATDLVAQNVLGTALMVKLRTDFNADTLAGYYDEIYNSDKASVMKMVIYQAYVLGLPRMLYKIGAETIGKGETDEVSSIDTDELARLQRDADASKAFYENQVKDYIVNNWSEFPELSDTTLDYIQPNTAESDTSQGTTYSYNNKYEL